MDAPLNYVVPKFVHNLSRFSMAMEQGNVSAVGNIGSGAWPAANRAYYYPIALPFPFRVKRVFVVNGGTVSGNFDLGIYSLAGTRIYSTGSTAQSGVSAFQYVSPTEFILAPGSYFFALAMDNTTGTIQRVVIPGTSSKLMGMLQQSTAFPLPASMTPATISDFNQYLFGVTSTDSGF